MIGFLGLSHLGIVYAVATAAKGMDVLGYDPDSALCASLAEGIFPVAEPGLSELFREHRARIRFTSQPDALRQCDPIFSSRDVPTDDLNQSNVEPLLQLMDQTAAHCAPDATAVILCQVPPGFTRSLKASGRIGGARSGANLFYQVETLVFGNAVERALRPERHIVGAENPEAPLPGSYAKWLNAFGCPLLLMRYESAELTKVAINLFLVSTVTTTNTLADLCERIGADWSEIAPALRLDKRIGPSAYLAPGLGIAGGNLERDLVTVQKLAARHGTEAGVVSSWQRNSTYRRDWVLRKVHEWVLARNPNPTLAIWGLAYKPDTHSTKNSPALALIDALERVAIKAYDPQVKTIPKSHPRLYMAASAIEACNRADALAIMTPWSEFSRIEPVQIKAALAGNLVIDPFGALDNPACVAAGLSRHQLGRSHDTV